AAAVACRLAAIRVAPTGLLESLDERLLGFGAGDLRVVGIGDEAASRGRWLGLANWHLATPPRRRGRRRLGSSGPRAPARWPSSPAGCGRASGRGAWAWSARGRCAPRAR